MTAQQTAAAINSKRSAARAERRARIHELRQQTTMSRVEIAAVMGVSLFMLDKLSAGLPRVKRGKPGGSTKAAARAEVTARKEAREAAYRAKCDAAIAKMRTLMATHTVRAAAPLCGLSMRVAEKLAARHGIKSKAPRPRPPRRLPVFRPEKMPRRADGQPVQRPMPKMPPPAALGEGTGSAMRYRQDERFRAAAHAARMQRARPQTEAELAATIAAHIASRGVTRIETADILGPGPTPVRPTGRPSVGRG